MYKKTTAILASVSLLMAAAPALAQPARAIQPAIETGLGTQGESAQFEGGSILGYVLLAAFAAASVFALIEIADDDEPDYGPVSP